MGAYGALADHHLPNQRCPTRHQLARSPLGRDGDDTMNSCGGEVRSLLPEVFHESEF
jgi:hypothetical protein